MNSLVYSFTVPELPALCSDYMDGTRTECSALIQGIKK